MRQHAHQTTLAPSTELRVINFGRSRSMVGGSSRLVPVPTDRSTCTAVCIDLPPRSAVASAARRCFSIRSTAVGPSISTCMLMHAWCMRNRASGARRVAGLYAAASASGWRRAPRCDDGCQEAPTAGGATDIAAGAAVARRAVVAALPVPGGVPRRRNGRGRG